MTTPVALLDTAVLAYVFGNDHEFKQPCIMVMKAAQESRFRAHASVELVQELLFHRLRRTDRATAVAQARDTAEACVLHPFDEDVMSRMFELVTSNPRIGGRDAVHAATALRHGIPTIVSPDSAFDEIPGLPRVDPRRLNEFLAASTGTD